MSGPARGTAAGRTTERSTVSISSSRGKAKPRTPALARARLIDRDLNWLEFNRRVLHEAVDERTPLLERVNFLSIFSSNLDEFVMKRIFGLREQVRAGISGKHPGNMTSEEKLRAMRTEILSMLATQSRAYAEGIRPALREHGIHLLEWTELSEGEQRIAVDAFHERVFPVLTPLCVDAGHPFPFISNLSVSLGVRLRDPRSGETSFARVKIPDGLPQWVQIETDEFGGSYRFVPLIELIRHHLHVLFPRMDVLSTVAFRVTRNAEVGRDDSDDADDLLSAIEEQVRQRRMEGAVRLEHGPSPDARILRTLIQELELAPGDVYEMPTLIEFRSLRQIAALSFPALRYKAWTPRVPHQLARGQARIFDAIRAGDILVHHPYDSFDATVLRLLEEAASDPNVLAIKMTIYRTGSQSPFVPLLIRAAESGKQVACLVELKARFDEQENITLSKKMEKAGVHVVYGFEDLKTHTKTMLIVRREGNGVRCYAHIGTGNYHYQTARLYVDLGLLTCDPDLTRDVTDLFNELTGRSYKDSYRKLLVAPATMKQRFLEMIGREIEHHKAGRPSRIIGKMNQLEDREICRALYEAGDAGIPIDLIVRGFCVIRPGVPGLSENVRVTSIIGRFLEHARIYYFRNGAAEEADGEFYIGSADWMHRNLEYRVEAVTPIEDPRLREELWEILRVNLADRRSAWDMEPDGAYTQRTPDPGAVGPDALGTQQVLMNRARCHPL